MGLLGTGSARLASSPAYRGASALSASATGGPARARVEKSVTAVTTGMLYARAYFFVPSGPSLTSWLVLMALHEAPIGDKISLDVYPNDALAVTATTAAMTVNAGPGTLPRNRWFCAELGVRIDRPNRTGFVQLWIDGAAIAMIPVGSDTRPQNGFSQIFAGIEAVNQDAAEIYMDELVVDTQRVGCD